MTTKQFNSLFRVIGESQLPPDIIGELESIARMHSISPQEIFYKWESYCIKMGSEETKLNIETMRDFKKDVQEVLERDTRGKAHMRSSERKPMHATPRGVARSDDVLDMLGGGTSKTSGVNDSSKRKATYHVPSSTKVLRSANGGSPTGARASTQQTNGLVPVTFNQRQNAGQIVETLNNHLEAWESPAAPTAESRLTLKANTDLKKFFYKPLAMHLSEASEVLDDRIDEFTSIIQEHYKLEDSAFGSAASKSTNEIVAVGRIASDSDGKLNAVSVVLEMSRQVGAGLRVPLKFKPTVSCELFPGQIVACKGTNASGDYFSVNEVLDIPLLPPAASLPPTLTSINERLGIAEGSSHSAAHALNIIVSSGPYTADDNLDFEPLHALCDKAISDSADLVLLNGPFIDIEHPLVAAGDFELPENIPVEPDKATLLDVFKHLVAPPLRRLAQALPSAKIVLVPSTRDAVNKHTSWPQEPYSKKDLGLPFKQVSTVSNPATLLFNEIVLAVSVQDVLWDLRRDEVVVGAVSSDTNFLARLPRHLIRQRHFYPIFPPADRSTLPKPASHAGSEETLATGTPLDTSYLKLGEWMNVRPDILVLPSSLMPFAKVVDSVVVINPGQLSKRRGAGTYAQMTVYPRILDPMEQGQPQDLVAHNLFERVRVDVIRI